MYGFLLLVSMLLLAANTAMAEAWLAFGDTRGYVAPCGCDPLTDLGGLRRLARFVAQEKALSPELMLFSTGNNLSPIDEEDKNIAVLTALGKIAPHAILFNNTEELHKAFLTEWLSHRVHDPLNNVSHHPHRGPGSCAPGVLPVAFVGLEGVLPQLRACPAGLERDRSDAVGA